MAEKKSESTYCDVAVCLGIKGKDGKRQEIVHQIDSDEVRIISVTHGINEKMRAVKEEKQLVGFEPTGEYELVLKVKFIKE